MFCRVQFSTRCCALLNYCNSMRSTVFVRIFMLTIHRSMNAVTRTNGSRYRSVSQHVLIMLLSRCVWTASRRHSKDRSSLVNNQSSSTSVAAVIASRWCQSCLAHRHRLEPRHTYRRWRIDDVTRNENGIIMFRHSATTTLYPTISFANRSSVADIVARSQSARLW